MTNHHKALVLARKLAKSFHKQPDLLAEMAAAYHVRGVAPPRELAAALGAVEHRRQAFLRVKVALEGQISGSAAKKIIQLFLEDIADDNATIMALFHKAIKERAEEGKEEK